MLRFLRSPRCARRTRGWRGSLCGPKTFRLMPHLFRARKQQGLEDLKRMQAQILIRVRETSKQEPRYTCPSITSSMGTVAKASVAAIAPAYSTSKVHRVRSSYASKQAERFRP